MVSCYSSPILFFTHCAVHLLPAMCLSHSGRSCDRVTPGCAEGRNRCPWGRWNDSVYFLNKVTLFCDVLTCVLFPRAFNWNPRPRRGKEGAIEKQIARKWHVITLQEAIDYVDHELLSTEAARCFSTKTLSALMSKSSPFTSMISDGRRPGMGFARSAFTCLISSTSSQRPENIYSSVLTY